MNNATKNGKKMDGAMNPEFRIKRERLGLLRQQYDSLAVAFSGGLDSAFLLAVAKEMLGRRVIAVTAESPIHPKRELEAAASFAEALDVRHIIVPTREMELSTFTANRSDRCYVCKRQMFQAILGVALETNMEYVAHGATIDDLEDVRPGMTAAHEMGIAAPMIDAKLGKKDIRILSRRMNLSTWNKPPVACLATRIPTETVITEDALKMVEKAEDIVMSHGFAVCRVRKHGDVARIEIAPELIENITKPETRKEITAGLQTIGFSHVALDLEGYISGKMNVSR